MRKNLTLGWAAAVVALSIGCGSQRHAALAAVGDSDVPPPAPSQEQPEVLTRGPVHEAFAEPVALENEAGIIAPTAPPANIEEVPPTERPEGGQIVWVPGYWAWDADRHGYIWVSACWRAAVPNRDWVPGYWFQVSGGYEWIPGFWSEGGVEIEYLPEPPVMTDMAAPSAAPSVNVVWAPPCWYWHDGQYIRRNGYWVGAQVGWVWVPSHYIRTPRGHVFAAGHWDYSLDRRGVLFAPVYVRPEIYGRADYRYSPSIVVDIGGLSLSLFAYPRYHHYYFGDYYDDSYVTIGIYPRFDCDRRHTWYDPIYEHDRWDHRRSEPRWEEHERHDYDARRADVNLRPARTYREMEARVAKAPEPQRKSLQIARPLSVVVASKVDVTVKFQAVTVEDKHRFIEQQTAVKKFGQDRSRWESEGAGNVKATPTAGPKVPVTPTAPRTGPSAKPADRNPVEPTAPPDRKGAATPQKETGLPPVENTKPTGLPTKPKGPRPPAIEPKGPVEQPVENIKPAVEPSKQKGPDKVKIPASPISGKSAGRGPADSGPPARPNDEEKPAKPTPPAAPPRAEPRTQPPERGNDAKDNKNSDDRKDSKDSKDNKNPDDRKNK